MKKALRVALLLGLTLMVALVSGAVIAAKKPVPEYVGSNACLGCHANRWSSWAGSHHASMITQVLTPSDIPGLDKATAEQKAEVLKADFVVSGGRFLARDKSTGNLVFLKYEWMHDEGEWIDYDDPGSIWQDRCMGCHVTPIPKAGAANMPDEFGIGCESCHGPGREHIQSSGDPNKIVLNASSDVCGQCHNSGYKMADNRWVYGYNPADKLADLPGIIMAKVDPNATANRGHHKEYPEWLVSGHGPKAVADLKASDHAADRCYACHTMEAFEAKQDGETWKLDKNAELVSISCVTCHHPHGLGLAEEEKTLCATCHTGSIAEGGLKPGATPHHPMKEFFEGWGAAGGITAKENIHAEVTCQECHMPNNNHLMQVIAPDDPGLKEGSDDSCTVCHGDSREVRGAYLSMWQDFTTKWLNSARTNMAAIEKAVKDGAKLTDEQKLKFDTAKTNVLFVEADGSMGAHNFEYAAKILSAANKDLAAVKTAVVK